MSTPRILITGANTGIGYATAERLVKQGAHVILACRNQDKARAAQQQLQQLGAGQVDLVALDLNSLADVQRCAAEIAQRYDRLDVLINNAGLFAKNKQLTVDGFEQQFGVNYLGHVLLTLKLLPLLQNAKQGRVINVASVAHWVGSIQPQRFRAEGRYNPLFFYGQSKLANLLFSHALAAQLAGSNVTSNALHPGAIDSEIYRGLPRLVHQVMRIGLVSTAAPAKLMEDMALSADWATRNGDYVSAQWPDAPSREAKDPVAAAKLHEQALALLADYL